MKGANKMIKKRGENYIFGMDLFGKFLSGNKKARWNTVERAWLRGINKSKA